MVESLTSNTQKRLLGIILLGTIVIAVVGLELVGTFRDPSTTAEAQSEVRSNETTETPPDLKLLEELSKDTAAAAMGSTRSRAKTRFSMPRA